MTERPAGRNVYGLRVRGLDRIPELPVADGPPDDRPVVRIRWSAAPPDEPAEGGAGDRGDRDRCVRVLADGRRVTLDRRAGTATFHGPPAPPDLLPHPYLASVATVVNRWAGREVFHAGAFVAAGLVWPVLGPRTAGKSSLLAALAADSVPIVADDILVSDGEVGYAGPRCLDLREPVPGLPRDGTLVRHRTRLRIPLPPVPDRLPVGGWFFLHWGAAPELCPIGAVDLLPRLAALRFWPDHPSDPAALLALATRPGWDLTRPRDWTALPHSRRLVDTAISGAAGVPA
ncbi:hypothetical protein [Plantactinospora sp. GCM10030261]|uniref:hypothetical protein n=1 Tax=Plantactinospora sp. GCM10030261 TaxID=3273420 RepID=UPI003620CA14